jgi:two-component system, LytTR family, response regulator
MKLTAIVVDDEPNGVEALCQSLQYYCPEVELLGVAHNIIEAQDLITKHKPQVVFLDIEMPEGTGFDLLAQYKHPDFKVIFVTGYDHYALNAIKFSALDYLLKPVAPDDLQQAVSKAIAQVREQGILDNFQALLQNLKNPRNRSNRITIPTQRETEFVEVGNIIRCEAKSGITMIYLQNAKPIASARDLKIYQELLEDYGFFRVHDSHIISYHHIRKILNQDGGLVQTTDNAQIPIARRRKQDFMEWMNEF